MIVGVVDFFLFDLVPAGSLRVDGLGLAFPEIRESRDGELVHPVSGDTHK